MSAETDGIIGNEGLISVVSLEVKQHFSPTQHT